jgi:hypothetical protein
MTTFIWVLSHDEMNREAARVLGAGHDLVVQVRGLKEGLPDRDCRALVVDLDSLAADRRSLGRLVKELSGRPRGYPVAAFSYNLDGDQVVDLRAAGVHVFEHGLGPEVFAAITALAPQAPPAGEAGY